jgi:hypothetical protein
MEKRRWGDAEMRIFLNSKNSSNPINSSNPSNPMNSMNSINPSNSMNSSNPINSSNAMRSAPCSMLLNALLSALCAMLLWIPSIVHADASDILSRFQLYATVDITSLGVGIKFSTLPRAEKTREFQQPSAGEETAYGVNLDFLPAYVIYAKDTSEDYLSLSGNLDTWYTWNRKLTFRVKDYLIRSQEQLEQSYSSEALPGQVLLGTQAGRPIYIRNVVSPSLEYRFGREDLISINYMNNIYRNESPLHEDSTENYISPALTYWFNIRNGISISYALDLGNFERSPDMTGNIATGRYTHRFNPKTSIFGDFKFEARDFDPQTIGSVNYEVYTPTIGFQHAFSPTLSLTASFGYFWQTQKIGEDESGPVYNVVLTQRAERTTYTLGVQGGYTQDYFTADNLGFAIYEQVIGSITHQFAERVSATLSARYQRADYRKGLEKGRVDNIWGVGGNLSYQVLRWLGCTVNLSYAENQSNRDINDYTDFRAMVGIRATY